MTLLAEITSPTPSQLFGQRINIWGTAAARGFASYSVQSGLRGRAPPRPGPATGILPRGRPARPTGALATWMTLGLTRAGIWTDTACSSRPRAVARGVTGPRSAWTTRCTRALGPRATLGGSRLPYLQGTRPSPNPRRGRPQGSFSPNRAGRIRACCRVALPMAALRERFPVGGGRSYGRGNPHNLRRARSRRRRHDWKIVVGFETGHP
jgi:hypothetical protein